MIVNDINEINKLIKGKVIDRVEQNTEGVLIYFTDGTKFKIKAFQYQMII